MTTDINLGLPSNKLNIYKRFSFSMTENNVLLFKLHE